MAVPVQRVVEGVVVSSGVHRMTFEGMCLTCGQVDIEPRCEQVASLGAPPLTVRGETA